MTDPHLCFLDSKPGEPVKELGRYLAKDYPEAEVMFITGDIAEAPSVRRHLLALHSGWLKPIWFCLGNHDYYHSAWGEVEKTLQDLPEGVRFLDPLSAIPVGDVAVLGQSGWFDALAARSKAMAIGETQRLQGCQYDPPDLVIRKMQTQSKQQAERVANKAREAYQAGFRKVVILTHAPPYTLASWHQGARSDLDWVGIMTSLTMGLEIDILVDQHPDLQVVVLCGHTHSAGEYHRGDRIKVLTGPAQYWLPQEIAGFTNRELASLFEPGRLAPDWPFATSDLGSL
jgi:predicted phosphohydrolase